MRKKGAMARYFKSKGMFHRLLSMFVICLFFYHQIGYAAGKAPYSDQNLSPSMRTSPIVSVDSEDAYYTVARADKDYLLAAFRKDAAFLYISALLGDALEAGLSVNGLRSFVYAGLSDRTIADGFHFERAVFEGNSIVIPYSGLVREGDGVLSVRIMRREDIKEEALPEALIIGRTAIYIENAPARSPPDFDKQLSDTISAVDPVKDPDISYNEDNPDESKRAWLDRGSLEKAVLFSLIFISLNFSPSVCLGKIFTDLSAAMIISIIAHEGFHIFQLLTLKGKRNIHFMPEVGLKGISIRVTASEKGLADRIILAGMVGSGTISTVFGILAMFYPVSFFTIMSIVNAVFAFSSSDISQLTKETDFGGAPKRVSKEMVRRLKGLFRGKDRNPLMLIGGYFSSGKSLLAHKIKLHLAEVYQRRRDIHIIGGDNWLLSSGRREKRGKSIYPYNKYEIDRWKSAAKRASEGLPLYVPFYLSTFRMRLSLGEADMAKLRESTYAVKEDGYFLLEASSLKDRPVRDFFPEEYIARLMSKVCENWKTDTEGRQLILSRLNMMLDRPLSRYVIQPDKGNIFVDAETGDIIEKVVPGKGDIFIMEFEQALAFDEINDLADLKVFVDGSFIHRREYFKGRRRKGERYSDLSEEETGERMISLRSHENELGKTKIEADIVAYNDEHLEEVVLEDTAFSRFLEKTNGYANGSVSRYYLDDPGQRSHDMVVRLRDTLLTKAHSAARNKQDIVIGIDTSWIPEMQKGMVQSVIQQLQRSSGRGKLSNVKIVRGNGLRLAEEVLDAITEDDLIACENVVLLGDKDILSHGDFDLFREGEKGGAFFAGISVPADFPDTGYTHLLEMLTISLRKAFEGGERSFLFELEASPLDLEVLRTIYDFQKEFLVKA